MPVLSFATQQLVDEPPIETDRPDFTESTSVVPKASLQIESGLTYERPGSGVRSLNMPEMLLRYGLSERWEVRFAVPNYLWADGGGSPRVRGFGDTYVGAKLELRSWRGAEFALIPAVNLPTGARGLRAEKLTPEVKLVYSIDLPQGLSLSGMTYAAFVRENGRDLTAWQHTLSLGMPVGNRVGMFVEHVADFQRGATPGHTLHSGFTYQPRPNTQFDMHYGIGLTRTAADFFVGAGYSVRF